MSKPIKLLVSGKKNELMQALSIAARRESLQCNQHNEVGGTAWMRCRANVDDKYEELITFVRQNFEDDKTEEPGESEGTKEVTPPPKPKRDGYYLGDGSFVPSKGMPIGWTKASEDTPPSIWRKLPL